MIRVNAAIPLRQHGSDSAHDFVCVLSKRLIALFRGEWREREGFPRANADVGAAEVFQIPENHAVFRADERNGDDGLSGFEGEITDSGFSLLKGFHAAARSLRRDDEDLSFVHAP